MINQLGDIMLYGNDKSYTEVLHLYTEIANRASPESKSNKVRHTQGPGPVGRSSIT